MLVLVVFFVVFLCVCVCLFWYIVSCAILVRERVSDCLIIVSAKQGSHRYHFNTFGMVWPGFEPAAPEAYALPLELSGLVFATLF